MKRTPLSKTIHVGSVKSLAVLSDLHLRDPNETNTKLATEEILALAGTELVVFLGDIFDFIFIGSKFFQKRWENFISACKSLQKSGTKIAFIEGNHDFGFEHHFPQDLHSAFTYVGDCILQCTHPTLGEISLRHGDDIVCPENYLIFRNTIKNKNFQKAASLLPGIAMHLIFSNWAKISRSQDSYRYLSPEFFVECVRNKISSDTQSPNILILGHVHENIDTIIRKMRCLAGPSWLTAPSILTCNATGEFQRIFVGGKDVPLFALPKSE